MTMLPLSFVPWLAALLAGYLLLAQIAKRLYIRYYGEWL
jgi:Mg2+-importing ATPase